MSTFFCYNKIGGKNMTRIRKEPNRYWSKEEKLKLINEVLNGKSSVQVAKENNISGGMLRNWVIKYNNYGEESLINKKKPGNPLCKYSNRKNLTDLEKLQYENMKLRIENERLKKGYMVEGDGQVVIFNGSKNKNLK